MNPLAAIAAVPPSFDVDTVAEAVVRQFGRRGRLQPLVSERDQNFCLVTTEGHRYLVKVTSAAEAAATTDLQVGVLRHLEQHGDLIAPRIIPTIDGAACGRIGAPGSWHRLRLLSWVDGEQPDVPGLDAALARRFGDALGRLDSALSGFAFDGENPVLLWDLQHIVELRPVLICIDDEGIRMRAAAVIDDYEANVMPLKPALPHQVIHADANPENIVVNGEAVGFIDFGDIVRAPRVFEPAIAASYLRVHGDDPLALVRHFIVAYHAAATLEAVEVDLFYDLVRARLATSVALLYWRLRDRPEDDEYRRKSLQSESNASQFLAALDAVGRAQFTIEIKDLLFRTA